MVVLPVREWRQRASLGETVQVRPEFLSKRDKVIWAEGGSRTHFWVTLGWADWSTGSRREAEFKVGRKLYESPEEITLLLDPADPEFVMIEQWYNSVARRRALVAMFVGGVLFLAVFVVGAVRTLLGASS